MSTHQGTTVTATLCARTIAHVKLMSREDPFDQTSYNFWTQHFRLDETIQYVAEYTSNQQPLEVDPSDNASELMLRFMLKAASICLHQAAIAKAGTIKGNYATQVQRSEALILENAIDIAKTLQTHELTETIKVSHYIPINFVNSNMCRQTSFSLGLFTLPYKLWFAGRTKACLATKEQKAQVQQTLISLHHILGLNSHSTIPAV
jgi:hypothetical protein